ncbi:MAG: release factor glutamine methyltransferase [Parvicellaceae bacterium]
MFVQENSIEAVEEYMRKGLASLYPEREVDAMLRILFVHFTGYNSIDRRINAKETLSESELLKFRSVLKEMEKGRPLQYALGETEFYGLKFIVNEHVLIPRPETEELVDLVLKENKIGQSLIDIGSGSGCISVSYAKSTGGADVVALDVDPNALKIVAVNSEINSVKVNLVEMDILLWTELDQKFDVVVSNPPYVLASERSDMSSNVLDFEPGLALFVNDNEPIIFYERIADFALSHLNVGGKLYFEINEKYGIQVMECLKIRNFKDIRIIKDLSGKNRIVAANV